VGFLFGCFFVRVFFFEEGVKGLKRNVCGVGCAQKKKNIGGKLNLK
jgi:hypothetical protein